MKARARASDADILVINHHLFFSDLAMRASALMPGGAGGAPALDGGGVLPEFSSVVIDEAHNLEDVAGEHLGPRLSQGGIYHWLRRLYVPATGKGILAALKEHELADEVSRLWEASDHFFMEVASWAALETRNSAKRVIDERLEFKTMLAEQMAVAVRRLEGLKESVADDDLRSELNAIVRRGAEIRQTLDFFLKEKEKNYVYWVERENFTGGSPRISRGKLALVAAPIDVAPALKDLLFNSFSPVVLTSATLAAGGSLEFFKSRVGAESCNEMVLGSPFDYQRRMRVYIPENMPAPDDEKFPGAVAEAVAHYVKKTCGRAFVLFTNAELMRSVAGTLESFFAGEGMLALVQGEGMARHEMLEAFRLAGKAQERQKVEGRRQNVKHGTDDLTDDNIQEQSAAAILSKSKMEKAVLFGLDSFWMGVDVRGEALSNVIIVRLPFSVPDEPLVRARIDLLEAAGRDAFREYTLPQAILKFRQGVGRLIRTANDEGIIVILDSRIVKRWYGRHFLESIPECPVERVRLVD
jgi:ATP-dependent DNA helicase DinG